MPVPEPGQVAPPFTLPDHDGNLVELASLRGSPVLLWFFSRAFGSN